MPRSVLLPRYFCTDSSLVEDELKDIPKEQLLFIIFIKKTEFAERPEHSKHCKCKNDSCFC